MGGSVGKRASYREALLNFNFREVSFSSRSNVKITFKGRVCLEKKRQTLWDCWGLNLSQEKAPYFTLRAWANMTRMAC